MNEKPPPVVDAEFEVVQAATPPEPKLKWWQGRYLAIDWNHVFIIAAIALAGLIARLTAAH